jgi:hypothetical protein
MSVLTELQVWYEAQCDGDWEHQFGIIIETLDNPGWSVTIDLVDTELEGKVFQEVMDLGPERDWIHCRVEGAQFRGAGGPHMLTHILQIFVDWAKSGS